MTKAATEEGCREGSWDEALATLMMVEQEESDEADNKKMERRGRRR